MQSWSSVPTEVPQGGYSQATHMKKLHGPKLIQLYAMCTREEPIYMITEMMKHGSLLEYLQWEGISL